MPQSPIRGLHHVMSGVPLRVSGGLKSPIQATVRLPSFPLWSNVKWWRMWQATTCRASFNVTFLRRIGVTNATCDHGVPVQIYRRADSGPSWRGFSRKRITIGSGSKQPGECCWDERQSKTSTFG